MEKENRNIASRYASAGKGRKCGGREVLQGLGEGKKEKGRGGWQMNGLGRQGAKGERGGEGGTCMLPWTRVENSFVLTA